MKKRIPQWVAKNLDLSKWGISQDHIAVLRFGPTHKDYWYVWRRVLVTAKRVVNGKHYKLKVCNNEKVIITSDCFDMDTRAF